MQTQVNAPPPIQPPMTKKQVADFFQVSERTIDRWRAEGRLPYFKYRGTVRFRSEWVDELLTKKTNASRVPFVR
jgi:excisionase family DNA binding protein